ncbi:hypothetical protein NM208_g2846 [Fusarium decemcellulare]|uniref:Uncharacterized protein n=1 Tax=Fusarium decemcellulare TaxID=57161 RepID=A0ACC1SR18_9HYPO|nr:hypothetical protein NM208_g2846 [Fusarium decemcellulare]
MQGSARSKQARWNRSFSGCTTCRLRHVKCDEEKPICTVCRQLGVECGGYETRILFDTDDNSCSSLFRRPLFTESERRDMSESMIVAAPPRRVFSLLAKLDSDCEKTGPRTTPSRHLQRGPFGAFIVSREHLQDEPRANTPVDIELPEERSIDPDIDQQISELYAADTFSQDNWLMDLLMPSHQEPTFDLEINDSIPFESPSVAVEVPKTPNPDAYSSGSLEDEIMRLPNLPSTPSIIPPFSQNSQLGEITMLLSGFKDTMIPLLSPFKSFKSPYSVIFLPLAKEALATLTLRESPGHASLTTFYSLLATSAFSMRSSPLREQWEHWNTRGIHFLTKAQDHLKITMSTAFHQPKVDKYKSILSAILSVIQASVFAGTWEQTESYLLDAEKFIRIKGLIKSRKSRKVRLLSHCYGYMRFFYESTFVLVDSDQRSGVRDAVKNVGVQVCGEDSIAFRLGKWQSALADQMIKPKTLEEGENDLHLETPGLWNNTLYSDVYEIPESFLVLLSQVIRLANETPGQSTTLSWSEFSTRAKDLESCICQWNPRQTITDSDNLTGHSDADAGVVEIMHQALQRALCIYFYRRIYDVDASVLQGHVRDVRDALLKCAANATSPVGFTAAFVWPGFIAACEALDLQLQNDFSAWFEGTKRAQAHRDASVQQVTPSVVPLLESEQNVPPSSITKARLTEREFELTECYTVVQLLEKLRMRELSSEELTKSFLRRAVVAQYATNCVTELLWDEAISRARYLDSLPKPLGPLHGLPISTKENQGMRGEGKTCNSAFAAWAEEPSRKDILLHDILWDAGCVFYSRTTLPQTVMQLETNSCLYGRTTNPYNSKHTSGGSSGGEGALIGMRGSILGIGGDIGGSIRVPAAFNGIYGFKPTVNRLPGANARAPMAGSETILGINGPMAADRQGLDLFMKVVLDSEPWRLDPFVVPQPWVPYKFNRPLKIGIQMSDGVVTPHPPITRALRQVSAACRNSGMQVVEWVSYKHKEAWDLTSALYFPDGGKDMLNVLAESGEPVLPLTKFIINEQPNVQERDLPALWDLCLQRDQYRRDYAAHWAKTGDDDGQEVDVILGPVYPGAAPQHNCSRYWSYTSTWNLLDYPAAVFPVTFVSSEDDRDTSYTPQNVQDEYNYSLYEKDHTASDDTVEFGIPPVPNNSRDGQTPEFTILRPEPTKTHFEVLKDWLTYCKAHHTKKCQTLPGYPHQLSCLKVIECQTGAIIKAPEGDAIQGTIRLNLHYLWVDQYCINQKDEAELAEQIGIIDMIYNLATVTLIAACGEDACFGLSGVSSTPRNQLPLVNIHGRTWVSSEAQLEHRIKKSRWWSRAWTYQEGLFSRRRIFFIDTEVYFECNNIYARESLSNDLHDSAKIKFTGIYYVGFSGHVKGGLDRHIMAISKRQLTHQSDALNAMGGIFRAFSSMPSPIRHFWGIPMERNFSGYSNWGLGWDKTASSATIKGRPFYLDSCFADGLGWIPETISYRRDSFPSWSWAGWVVPLRNFEAWHCRDGGTSVVKTWLQRTDGTYTRISESVISEVDAGSASGAIPYTQILRIEIRTIQLTFRYLPGNRFERPSWQRNWAYPNPMYFAVTFSSSEYHGHRGIWYWPLILSAPVDTNSTLHRQLCEETFDCLLLSSGGYLA